MSGSGQAELHTYRHPSTLASAELSTATGRRSTSLQRSVDADRGRFVRGEHAGFGTWPGANQRTIEQGRRLDARSRTSAWTLRPGVRPEPRQDLRVAKSSCL